jgi:MFS family permease
VTEPASPLHIRDYRLIWLARFLSVLATTGMVVIIGYQLYDLARSVHGMSIGQASFLLGVLGLAQFVPFFLLTPVAGVVADRFDRRWVAGAATIVDIGIAAALAVATWSGQASLALLFLLAAMHGAARVFIGPSLTAILPNVVPAALMPRAIALGAIAFQIGTLAGPTAAGFLFGDAAWLPYACAAVLLAVAALAVLSIRRIPLPEVDRAVHPLRQFAEGFRFVRKDRLLLGCMTLDLFAVILGGATALLPVFARDVLHVGPEGLGIMRAMPGAGAAVVAAAMSWRPIARNVGVKMLWGVAIYGAATVGFGLSRDFLLSLAFLALLGAADMVSVYVRSSLVQLNTPDDKRGRVASISGLAISASNELGEMQSGLAAALLGATGAVVFGGAAAIFITVLWAVIFPELRAARSFAPQYRER